MRYADLVQFDPIESVIKLTDANDKDYAFHLLNTYVISERMAEILDELVFEQLQYDRPTDHKGLLIVGNYGTGKSHLMSVLSTIAEREGAAQHIQNLQVAERAKEIEGRFKVIRTEIGGVQTSLRDIICTALEEELEKMGVPYSFPPVDQVRNNKDALIEMMAAFHAEYPEHGLLLVVDELLDFLKSRKEQQLYLDLGFLREVGEICSDSRFRFMAGVQEMLFDNPTFQFVAKQLRRVSERFEQVSIVREDLAHVVAERLLKKDERQKALVREHLQQFTRLYHRLGEDLEQFVNLFPIHPEYLATFEKVTLAEKRVILKTLSHEMKKIMDQAVPSNEPGVLSFDSYWPHIENDASLKSDPDVKEVISKTAILKDRIQHAFTRPLYKPVAQRIVQALAVFRLTTDDIYAPVGLTPDELRDGLFLHFDLLDEDDPADFLKTSVEAVLREIQKTVSYQYISSNDTNGQYYLDIKKDIAVDELIEQRAEVLTDEQLDRYYFEALKQATDVVDTPYVPGYKIWSHQLPWDARKVVREGYIFFGAPNERSTAQPPRDFYIYMLQPFAPPKFKDEARADEVFFRLVERDETFLQVLKLYAGAQEMTTTVSSSTRKLYEQKADHYLKEVVSWIREHLPHAYEVTYQGKSERLSQLGMFVPRQGTVREMVDAVSTHYLSQWFEEKYPDYPSFRTLRLPLTPDNLTTYVQDAFKQISGTHTRQGHAILDGLVLLESEQLNPHRSGYARWVLDRLKDKGSGQVINRSALIETVYMGQGTVDLERTTKFHLEPELFVVILAALVYNGDIVITINGKTYDAMRYAQLIALPLSDIIHFSHIKKPSDLPLAELQALFDLFDISRGLLRPQAMKLGIVELQKQVRSWLDEAVKMLHSVKGGIYFMNQDVLSGTELDPYTEQLDELKSFLESLQVYDTPAKMRNFRYSVDDLRRQQGAMTALRHLDALQHRVSEYSRIAHYIEAAKRQMHARHEWVQQADEVLGRLVAALKRGESGQDSVQQLEHLRERYQEMYFERHGRARLNATEEHRKSQLLSNPRIQALDTLAREIDLLPEQALTQWKSKLRRFKACWKLTRDDLRGNPVCPHCQFELRDEYDAWHSLSLEAMEEELEHIERDWVRTLLTELSTPEAQDSLALLTAEAQASIQTFIEEQAWALPLDPLFVQTVKQVLQGIDRVEISLNRWIEAVGGGRPLTVEELRQRLERLLRDEIGDRSESNVRIMLALEEEFREPERYDSTVSSS